MSWDDLGAGGVRTTPSAFDTARFGLQVARTVVGRDTGDHDAADRVAADLERLAPDVTVARWPAERLGLAPALVARGLDVRPADTLVYWEGGASSAPRPPAVVPLTEVPHLAPSVPELVRGTFADYPTHYLATSAFAPELVLEGYVEWASRAVLETPDEVLVHVVDDELAAFATTMRVEGGRATEVLLAGTHPVHRGRGVYRSLLEGALASAAEEGRQRLLISTQAANTAVQRVWCTVGLRPVSAWTTVHLTRR